jgi:hypothetical protein
MAGAVDRSLIWYIFGSSEYVTVSLKAKMDT